MSPSIDAIASDENQQRELSQKEKVASSLLAGAFAGALAKTTIAPMDRTKIYFQVNHTPYSTTKAFKFMLNSYKTDGIRSLWRGNSATMARIIPYASIQFTAHDQWKHFLRVESNDKADEQFLNLSPQVRRFLAGSLAGVTSQSLTYPLDLARACMAVTKKDQYATLSQVFSYLWKENGIIGLYRGYTPTILGIIPYAGASFFTYGTLKQHYIEKKGHTTFFENLCFGAISGVCGQTTSYPLDIIRRRMQTATTIGNKHSTMKETIRNIYRFEGVRKGFFKGLSMNWIKGPIAVGVSFSTYDWTSSSIKKSYPRNNKQLFKVQNKNGIPEDPFTIYIGIGLVYQNVVF